jgi:hypothetical protein
MALTPEEMERITREERRKLEEEAYRSHVRRQLLKQNSAQRNLPAIVGFVALVMLFLTALVSGWFLRPAERPPLEVPAISKSAPPTTSAPATTYVPNLPNPQERSRTEAVSSNGIPASVQALLSNWRDTLVNHDLDGHVNCYAPVVYVFYNRKNVSRSGVREDRERTLSTYPKIRKYNITNVKPESITPTRAVVTFDKEWDTAGKKRFAGAERGRLTLEKLNGEWKIVAEQEARVYWVKR